MGQIDKNLKNQLFKAAVDYIYQEHLADSQGELANKIGISKSALSRIMNNKKFVGDDTLRKMNEAFGGIFNMAYFRGEDNEPMLAADLGKSNPQQSAQAVIDPSSMVNAIIAAHNNALATKDELLSAKDETIAGLKRELSTKDELIISLRQQLLQLQQLQRKETSIPPYPYPTGVADDKKV